MKSRHNPSRPTPLPYDLIDDLCTAILHEIRLFVFDRIGVQATLGDALVFFCPVSASEFTSVDGKPFSGDVIVSVNAVTSTGLNRRWFDPNRSHLLLHFGQFSTSVSTTDSFICININGDLAPSTAMSELRGDALSQFRYNLLETLYHEFTHCVEQPFISQGHHASMSDSDYINSHPEFSSLRQEVWLCCGIFRKEFERDFKHRPDAISSFLRQYCAAFSEYATLLSSTHYKKLMSLAYVALYN